MIHELLPWLLSIGKYVLASAALLLFYRIVFRKNASYTESRVFLLSVAVVAVLVSQFRIQISNPAPTIVEVEQEAPVAVETPIMLEAAGMTIPVNAPDLTASNISTSGTSVSGFQTHAKSITKQPTSIRKTFDWLQSHPEYMLFFGYLLVVIVLIFNLILQYRSIRKLRRRGSVTLQEGYKLVEHPEVSTPFSFAKTIFLPSNLNESQREVVLSHELWHIQHKHYVDVLLQEILSCLFWFNPVQWLLRKDLRSVHEFQADRSVLNEGCDLYRYQTIILEEVMGNHYRLANGFNQSFTKKRFIQMKNSEPIRLTTVRKLLFVPFLTLLFAFLCFVPGKSQVITVKRSSTTTTIHNGKKKTVTTESTDTMPYSQQAIDLGFTPQMSPNQLQQSFNLSLDTLQGIVDKALPLVHHLAISENPSKDVQGMNALMEAMNMTVNKQGFSYNDFSEEAKNSFTRQDFKEFEQILRNMDDSIRVLRTRKVERFDSPDILKPVALAQGMMGSSFIKKVLPEMFRAMTQQMSGMMESMTGAMGGLTSGTDAKISASIRNGGVVQTRSQNVKNDVSEAQSRNVMSDAFSQLGSMMGEMTKTMGQAVGSMGQAVGNMEQAVGNMTQSIGGMAVTEQAVTDVVTDGTVLEAPLVTSAKPGRTTTRQTNNPQQQTALANIAYNEENAAIRKQAVEKITNQTVLANVAYNDESPEIRMIAVSRLSNQMTLNNVAYNDDSPAIRKLAVSKLTSETALANVAYNDDAVEVRKLAVQRISNQTMLANVAYNDDSPSVRMLAVSRLTNQTTLYNVANNDDNESVKIAAIKRLTQASYLSNIINSTDNINVKQAATTQLLSLNEKPNR